MSATRISKPGARFSIAECLSIGSLFYYLTSLIPILGVVAGDEFVHPLGENPIATNADLISRFSNWDGVWYKRIAREGYQEEQSINVAFAFFPAYPLLGRWIAQATGMRLELALLLVSHAALLAAFVLTVAYVHRRYPDNFSGTMPEFVLLAFGLIPSTCFFRFTYTESLFVFLIVLGLYGMERRWPLVLLAAIVGTTSAVRAVGVGFAPAFLVHIWGSVPHTRWNFLRTMLIAPLTCWGIIAYMLFQLIQFGDPLLFVKAEVACTQRQEQSWPDKIQSDLTLATVWRVYDPAVRDYWQNHDAVHNPLFSLPFANPLYFIIAAALISVGIRKRWLNRVEATLSGFLLLIPYFSKGYDICMVGTARFVSVIFPLYLVMGNILVRLPPTLVAALLALGGFYLALYAALFAAHYLII